MNLLIGSGLIGDFKVDQSVHLCVASWDGRDTAQVWESKYAGSERYGCPWGKISAEGQSKQPDKGPTESGIELQRCKPHMQMWQKWEPQAHTHTETHTVALAAPMSCVIIMCQNTSKLCQQGLPQENPSPPQLALWPFLTSLFPYSPFYGLCSSLVLSPHFSTSIFLPSLHHTFLHSSFFRHTCTPPHSPLPTSLSLSLIRCYPFYSHPPFLHLRTWQSYHYHATYLLAACYFPFALRGPRAKSLPTILDPSHRIYPRVAWQVWSTPPSPPFLSFSPHLSFFSFSIACSHILSFFLQFFFLPWPLMQIQALLFKELSTHNPMDGSIFGVLHTHIQTHICACRKHSIRNTRAHAISHKHSHQLAHICTLTCRYTLVEWHRTPSSAAWVLYFQQWGL